MVMRVLEKVGLRQLHLFTSRVTGEPALPAIKDAPNYAVYSADEIYEMKSGTRYFGRANFWRMIFHIPVLVLLAHYDKSWITLIFVILILFHAALLLMESYKATIIDKLPAVKGEEKVPEVVKSEVWGEWYFAPKEWETEKLYKLIGGYWFKALVEYVIDHLRLTKEERESGKTVEYIGNGPAGAVKFENGSRVSECVHLTMAAIDILPIVVALSNKLWLALPYTVFVIWSDFGCAILQRLNRTRVWTLIKRARQNEARARRREES